MARKLAEKHPTSLVLTRDVLPEKHSSRGQRPGIHAAYLPIRRVDIFHQWSYTPSASDQAEDLLRGAPHAHYAFPKQICPRVGQLQHRIGNSGPRFSSRDLRPRRAEVSSGPAVASGAAEQLDHRASRGL